MKKPVAIGELKRGKNTQRKRWSENIMYNYVHVMINGTKTRLALTDHQVYEAVARAYRNPEDFSGTHWTAEVKQLLRIN